MLNFIWWVYCYKEFNRGCSDGFNELVYLRVNAADITPTLIISLHISLCTFRLFRNNSP